MSAPIRIAAHTEPALLRAASLSATEGIKTPVTGTSASFYGKQQSFIPFFSHQVRDVTYVIQQEEQQKQQLACVG